MPSTERRCALRPFVTGHYLPDDQSRLRPGVIVECPLGKEIPGPCRILSKGWRKRKTGPFALLKRLRCLGHCTGFTVFPFGMMPFARRSLVDIPRFAESVEDAVAGKKWPIQASGQGSVFKTQKRHILALSKVFGVDSSLSDQQRLAASLTLKIPTICLLDGATKIREGPTFAGRAQVVMDVLKRLGGVYSLATILRRGFECKLWGTYIMDERDQLPLFHFTINDG